MCFSLSIPHSPVLTHIPLFNHECDRITNDFGYSAVRELKICGFQWKHTQKRHSHHSRTRTKSLRKRVQFVVLSQLMRKFKM